MNKWDIIDIIGQLQNKGELSYLEGETLIAEVHAAAYNRDYEELNKIEKLLLEKGDSYV